MIDLLTQLDTINMITLILGVAILVLLILIIRQQIQLVACKNQLQRCEMISLVKANRENDSLQKQVTELNVVLDRSRIYKVLRKFLMDKNSVLVRRIRKSNDLVFVTTTGLRGEGFIVDVFSTNQGRAVAYTQTTSNGIIDLYSHGRNDQPLNRAQRVLHKKGYERWVSEGYGSVMMEQVITYAKLQGMKNLNGKMMETNDDDHDLRLHKFYSKFNFTLSADRRIHLRLES